MLLKAIKLEKIIAVVFTSEKLIYLICFETIKPVNILKCGWIFLCSHLWSYQFSDTINFFAVFIEVTFAMIGLMGLVVEAQPDKGFTNKQK